MFVFNIWNKGLSRTSLSELFEWKKKELFKDVNDCPEKDYSIPTQILRIREKKYCPHISSVSLKATIGQEQCAGNPKHLHHFPKEWAEERTNEDPFPLSLSHLFWMWPRSCREIVNEYKRKEQTMKGIGGL